MANKPTTAVRPTAKPNFEFEASVFEGKLLGEGNHIVTIESLENTESKPDDRWNDVTPQLAVKFKSDDGVLTNWYNKRGYTKYDELSEAQQKSGKYEPRGDSSYAVEISTGNRVQSVERTKKAMSIIGQLGTDALGLEAGTGFNGADLIGAEVGIHVVRNEQNKLRIAYTMSPEKVEA